jgi:hypothetical protein
MKPPGGRAEPPPEAPRGRVARPPHPFARLGAASWIFRGPGSSAPIQLAGEPRALLAGDLSRVDTPDLVNFLNMSRLTGILLLAGGERERALHVHRGEIVFAATNSPDERIGEVLVRLGKINHRQLDEVGKQFRGNMRIGRFLVLQELISPQVLWEGLREQVRQIFFACLEMARGEVYFLDPPSPEAPELNLSLTTRNLLLEGVQRKDELAHYRLKIPEGAIFVRRDRPPAKELSDVEKRILRLVDGKSGVPQLAMLCQIDRFAALKTLFHLSQAGFIEIARAERAAPAPPRPAPPPAGRTATASETRLREIVQVFNAIYGEIREALSHKLPPEGTLKTLNAFFQNLDPGLVPLFRGVRLSPAGALDPDALLRNLAACAASPREEFLTGALKELFFFCIFEATSRLEPHEEQSLLERVQKLQNDLRA